MDSKNPVERPSVKWTVYTRTNKEEQFSRKLLSSLKSSLDSDQFWPQQFQRRTDIKQTGPLPQQSSQLITPSTPVDARNSRVPWKNNGATSNSKTTSRQQRNCTGRKKSRTPRYWLLVTKRTAAGSGCKSVGRSQNWKLIDFAYSPANYTDEIV